MRRASILQRLPQRDKTRVVGRLEAALPLILRDFQPDRLKPVKSSIPD